MVDRTPTVVPNNTLVQCDGIWPNSGNGGGGGAEEETTEKASEGENKGENKRGEEGSENGPYKIDRFHSFPTLFLHQLFFFFFCFSFIYELFFNLIIIFTIMVKFL